MLGVGLYEAPAIEHQACPSTMGGEPPRAIKHPAVIGLGGLRALFLLGKNEGNLPPFPSCFSFVIELELIQTQMTQKPMLWAEVGMRVRCANKASAE